MRSSTRRPFPPWLSALDALAAVNAGFFLLPSGDPAGIYKLNGQLVSDTRRPRGAVGIIRNGPIAAIHLRPGLGDDAASGLPSREA